MTEQTPPSGARIAYAAAGVDLEAADKAITLMRGWVEKTVRPEVIGSLGGFAGLYDASALTRYTQPILATSTDGAGTKVAIAQAMDVHDTIGFDLVGMVVDDLVVCGAEPLFMTDYIACGRVEPERIAAIVKGIAEACVEAGCALIGGETAEHPGLMEPDAYDVAGAATGVVEASAPARTRPGPPRRRRPRDGVERAALQRLLPGPPRPARAGRLGARPRTSTSWAARSARSCSSRPGSTPRPASRSPPRPASTRWPTSPAAVSPPTWRASMPEELSATIDRSTWVPAPVFDVVRRVGAVSQDDLESTLNCGVGMVALLPADDVDRAVATLDRFGVHAWAGGRGRARPGPRRRGPAHGSVRRLGRLTGRPDPCFGPFGASIRAKCRPFRDGGVREQPPIG